MDDLLAGNFFSRNEDEVRPPLLREVDGIGIDEPVVLAENQEVVAAVEIPSCHVFGGRVSVAAEFRVRMGIPLIPGCLLEERALSMGTKREDRKEKIEREQSVKHSGIGLVDVYRLFGETDYSLGDFAEQVSELAGHAGTRNMVMRERAA